MSAFFGFLAIFLEREELPEILGCQNDWPYIRNKKKLLGWYFWGLLSCLRGSQLEVGARRAPRLLSFILHIAMNARLSLFFTWGLLFEYMSLRKILPVLSVYECLIYFLFMITVTADVVLSPPSFRFLFSHDFFPDCCN